MARALLGALVMRNSILSLPLPLVLLTACPAREVSKIDPQQQPEVVKDVPISVNRDLDILFLIDNSDSMGDKQASLVANFPRFIDVLQNIPGGLPNIHIGIASSNVGVGGYNIGGCGGDGDDGRLQNTPRGACTPPSGYYISDVADPMTGARVKNYSGTLADTFTCIAKLGTGGCGFEAHFEGVKRALDGHNPQNAGFLRDGAYLAIVIVGDEDDCSAKDTSVFDPSQTSITDPLGPLASFRCTEFGLECDGAPITRSAANYTNCTSNHGTSYLQDPQVYADFLRGLKADPENVIVAVIGGNPTPVGVHLDGSGRPTLDHSCCVDGTNDCIAGATQLGGADPGVRFNELLGYFPDRGTFTSICSTDLSDALTQIATLLTQIVGTPCLRGNIDRTDLDPSAPGVQLDCSVADVLHENESDQTATPIARCEMMADGVTPADPSVTCWYVVEDDQNCSSTETHLIMTVQRPNGDPPPGTRLVAHCRAANQ
jgi:hypothetical protein